MSPAKFDTWAVTFLIYINDLADELSSNAKLFAYDTRLFSVVHNIDSSADERNNDVISHWVHQWKMNFNPGPNKKLERFFSAGKLIRALTLLRLLITI